jgi:3-deoxy-D-manno-octulosonic-acid transferase
VPEGVRVLVVDAIGELGRLYGAADAAFVGGSLVPRGGHNVLEPVAAGVPTLHGPWMDNFRDLVRILSPAGLVMEVLSADDLAKSLCRVLAEVDLGDFRRRARDVIERQVKAADMIGDWVAANLKASK